MLQPSLNISFRMISSLSREITKTRHYNARLNQKSVKDYPDRAQFTVVYLLSDRNFRKVQLQKPIQPVFSFSVWSGVILEDNEGVRCSSLMTLTVSKEALSELGTSTYTWRSTRTPVAKCSAPCGLSYWVPRNIADSSSDESDITAISPRALIPRRIKITR